MDYTLITGASSGIGRAFAFECARRKSNLVLVARSGQVLDGLARELASAYGIRVEVCTADLSEPDSARRVFSFCRNRSLHIGLLINSAGFGCAGEYADMPPDELESMVQVNMLSHARLIRLFVPSMLGCRKGGIINVASLGGLQGVAFLSLYSATKSFVMTLSEALHEELRGTGVRVVAVCPGYVDTGFHDRSGQDPSQSVMPVYDASRVVRAALRGLKKNRGRVFPVFSDTVLAGLQRCTPRKVVLRLAALLAPHNYSRF